VDTCGYLSEDFMITRCERHGQTEIGVIEHQGREFSAFGATVNGRHVTAYTKMQDGHLTLVSWCGQTRLACRAAVVQNFWDGSFAVLFRLARRRYIVGYALDENGFLFRGELLTDCSQEVARERALRLADRFAELDAEDAVTENEA
jgi:hypothetical protein